MKKRKHFLNKKGFTLLELLLSVSIIAFLSGIGMIVLPAFYLRNNVDVSVILATQNLERAKILAQIERGDDDWGLKIENGKMTLFKGASFSGRDIEYDEGFSFPGGISFNGDTEFIFQEFSGKPVKNYSISFSGGGISRVININGQGAIDY